MAIDYEQAIAELKRQLAAAQDAVTERDRALAERTRERDEGRARERTVGEILQLLSTNPTDQRAVFRAILGAAQRIFGSGTLWLLDGEMLRHGGTRTNAPGPFPPGYRDGEPYPALDHACLPSYQTGAAILE